MSEWHDLRKDSADLPSNERYVWTNQGPGHYDADGIWRDDFGRMHDVIAWCEPKFELEEHLEGTNDQLTKAKEIIKNLMVFAEIDSREYEENYKEAEEFLKEESLKEESLKKTEVLCIPTCEHVQYISGGDFICGITQDATIVRFCSMGCQCPRQA